MINQAAQVEYRPQDLKEWQQLYRGDGTASPDDLCAQALADFGKFSDKFSAYFNQIIQRENFDRAKTNRTHLQENAKQALNDYWKPLGEVLMQRQVSFYRNLLNQEATPRAKDYLDQLGLRQTGVLVYFNKVATIRYCPYTPIAFIGTPYTMLDYNDWMGIPHEAGHIAYWNLGQDFATALTKQKGLQKSVAASARHALRNQGLKDKMSQQVEKALLSWLEETFCDVVGTRLAKAEFVQSLQSVIEQSNGTAADLATDDGRHPPYFLRPFVRELTLSPNGQNPVVNWDKFFSERFSVRSIRKQNIPILLTDRKRLTGLSKTKFLNIVDNKTAKPKNLMPTMKLSVEDILPALQAMVKCLNEEVDTILKNGLPARSMQVDPMEQLLAIAEQDKKGKQPIYELLLHPRILEGGEDHGPHDALGHLQWHTVPAHKH